MRTTLPVLGVLVLLMLLPMAAVADWNPGDGHKMHFPQMPDPEGWDVNFTLQGIGAQLALADDWQCTRSGPVSDIHFWFSSRGDVPATISDLFVSIYDDVPAEESPTGFSMPGKDPLWTRYFIFPQIGIRQWGEGDQGWYDLARENPEIIPHDHHIIYEANLVDIPDPFLQEEGKTYWLALTTANFIPGPPAAPLVGWKTSLDHWNDAAVFNYGPAIPPQPSWHKLADPVTGVSLDLAFVITPEPSTVTMLLGAAGAGLVAFRWRRFSGESRRALR